MTTSIRDQLVKQLADKAAEKLTERLFDQLCDQLHEVCTEVCDEELSGIIDPEADDYLDFVMEVAGSIYIGAQ